MWLLLIILGITILSVYDGYQKGFIKIALSFVALFATLVIVVLITPTVTDFLKEHTPIFEKIQESTTEFLEKQDGFNKDKNDKSLIEAVPVPNAIKDYLKENNTTEKYAELNVGSTKEFITERVATLIFNAIIFLILFIAVYIAVKVAINVLDVVSRLPILNEANKLAGVAIGLAQGVLIVWIFFVVITIAGNTDFAKMMFEQIEDNAILTFIYDNNYLMKLLMSLIK